MAPEAELPTVSNLLELRDVNQSYGQSHTLWDIDLDVPEGQCTVVMGRNGVGKTTLMETIMGMRSLDSGSIRFAGEDISRKSIEYRAPAGIGLVPQGRQIFPLLSVEENLQIGLSARKDRARSIPGFIYELFPVLKQMLGRRGGDLSGGQQQQLAIGRALVIDPKLLILDEPTEGIQPNLVADIATIIRRLNQEFGLTVIIVEQKLPFARKVADRYVILDRGRKVSEGRMPDLSDAIIQRYLTV